MTQKQAKSLAKAVVQIKNNADDRTATLPGVIDLLHKLKYDGSLIEARTAINFGGEVKRAAVDLWDTEANNPTNAPNLWHDVQYKNGKRWIKEGESIPATEPFMMGDEAYFGRDETLYRSKLNNNVWTPINYPNGWEVDIVE